MKTRIIKVEASETNKAMPIVVGEVIKLDAGYGYRLTIKDRKGHVIRILEQTKVLEMLEQTAEEKCKDLIRRYLEAYLKEFMYKYRDKLSQRFQIKSGAKLL